MSYLKCVARPTWCKPQWLRRLNSVGSRPSGFHFLESQGLSGTSKMTGMSGNFGLCQGIVTVACVVSFKICENAFCLLEFSNLFFVSNL